MGPSEQALRVVLADDHHFFREGLRGMLLDDGMTVVGEAADGVEAVSIARKLEPDIVVLDLNMPGASGMDALRKIAKACPRSRLVVLTVSVEEADVMEALAAGASSYLLKDTRLDELAAGIRLAAGGQSVLSSEIVRALVANASSGNHAVEPTDEGALALTTRELEVIRLIVEGADNAAIGRELSISRHTVKQYVTNIFEKLDVQSRVQAAVYAVRKGLV
jgi:DNA-binding NarL/FixJ family response regulator